MSKLHHAFAVKLLISVTLLVFLAVQMSWNNVVPAFLAMSVSIIFGAFVLLTLQTLLLSVRWFLIVNTGRHRMGYKNALQITFAALIANFLFLTSISGLAVRVMLTVRQKVSLLFALGASLIDRLMTVLALLVLAAIFMPFAHNYMGVEIIVVAASLFATLAFLLAALFALSKTKYGTFLQSSRKTATTIKYMQSIFTKPKHFASIMSISLLAQITYFGAVYALMMGMDIKIDFLQVMTVLPMIALISSLPIGVGGWGVREGAFVYGLGLLGVGIEQAFLVSIQIGLIGLISATIVGLPTWFLQDRQTQEI